MPTCEFRKIDSLFDFELQIDAMFAKFDPEIKPTLNAHTAITKGER